MMRTFVQALWAIFMMVSVAQAQFNFFDHMFGGGQQQQGHQGSQNVPSDSGRYQSMWNQGINVSFPWFCSPRVCFEFLTLLNSSMQ